MTTAQSEEDTRKEREMGEAKPERRERGSAIEGKEGAEAITRREALMAAATGRHKED